MSEAPPPRVRWREGQTLRAGDLAAEQAYRLEAAGRHRRGLHRPGVVSGLAVRQVPGGGVTVAAGTAVDARGDELVLPRAEAIAGEVLAAAAERLGSDALVLTLRRRAVAGGGEAAAGPDACAAGARPRHDERSCLQLAAAPADTAPRPPHLPALPAGAAAAAAVPLARLDRDGVGWRVLPLPGAGAGLVAQRLVDPAGRAEVVVADAGGRLTVAVGDGVAAPAVRLEAAPGGAVTLRGGAGAGGALRLIPEGAAPAGHLRLGALAATPEEPRPWSFYRTDVQPTDDAGQPAGPVRRQLRFEIAAPGRDDDPAGLLLAVGRHGDGGTFTRRLTVDARRRLTVGRLVVAGQVAESPIPPDPADPRFAFAAAAGWLRGIGTALGQTATVAVEAILPTALPLAGGDLDFSIRARNPGPAELQQVRLFSQLSGAAERAPAIQRILPVLAAGDQARVAARYAALAAGDYTLTVTVIATGPGTTPVSASAQADFVVLEPIP